MDRRRNLTTRYIGICLMLFTAYSETIASCNEGINLSQEKLRKIVRHERRVELAFENLHMADLYRWGEWKANIDRMNADRDFYGIRYKYEYNYRGPQDEVWPIPQTEIDTNSKLEQHDEWK